MSELLNSLKGQLSTTMVDQLASKLGENPSNITKAMGGLLPTIMSGLVSKTGDSNAMSSIFNMLKGDSAKGLLDNMGGLMSSGSMSHDDPSNPASGLLNSLFGGKMSGILNMVSSFSGVKSSSASSLMGMAGSMVMGFLGKKVAGGMDLSSLTGLLSKEKSGIMAAMPSGMGNLLNLSMPNVNVPKVNTGGGSKWMWILLAAAAAALLFWWKGCNTPEVPKVDVPVVNVDTVAKKVDVAVENTTAAITGWFKKLGTGFELKGDSVGIERNLVEFVESDKVVDKTTWFNFDRLTFKTGSADLDMEKSQDQLNNMNEILKAYPKMNLKIGGYTDNTGSADGNVKLSQKRAEAVMAALTGMGIDKARLEAEGYGSQHPICPANDTEECKAKNRRISVRVTQK